MRVWILSLFLAALGPQAFAQRGWTQLEGVRVVPNASNDGDSFHAKRNRSTYVFRLYFVDAPETDARYPDRLKEQAEYFGLEEKQAVAAGKAAAAHLEKLLGDQELTVHTRYVDARGAGDQKRHYAMVRVGDRWLSELLVEQGYARIYGLGDELPDGTAERIYWARLRKLEREAREANRGLWGMASGKIAVESLREGQRLRLPRETPIFRREAPHALVGNLPAGWEVELGPATREGFREVGFTTPGGANFIGELQVQQLKE